MIQEMRRTHQAVKQTRDSYQTRADQIKTRTSARTHTKNRDADYAYTAFVYAPIIHGRSTRAAPRTDAAPDTREEFAEIVTNMLEAEESLSSTANTKEEKETFEKILLQWRQGWRATAARQQETRPTDGTITYMPDPKG